MSSSKPSFIEHEATTEFATNRTIGESEAMQVWLAGLAPDEQSRFYEFAHHLYHTGFIDGLQRSTGPGITDEQRANVLAHQASLYLLGVNDTNELNGNEPEGEQ